MIKHQVELKTLTKEANEAFQEGKRHSEALLDHVVKCGHALNRIRYITNSWKRPSWKKWLDDNFEGSYETATVYIKIARAWDKPKMVEARNQNRVDSIRSALSVLSEGNNASRKSEDRNDVLRKTIGKEFAVVLRKFCREELEAFDDDLVWEKIYELVYNAACLSGEYDLNEYLFENGKLETTSWSDTIWNISCNEGKRSEG